MSTNLCPMLHETIWFDKWRYVDAEDALEQALTKNQSLRVPPPHEGHSPLVAQIMEARMHIQNSLISKGEDLSENIDMKNVPASLVEKIEKYVEKRIASVEAKNEKLEKVTDKMSNIIKDLENRLKSLETGKGVSQDKAKPAAAVASDGEDDDDDFELFGSDEENEDEAAEELKAKRIKEYEARKSHKPTVVAKSNLILDIKPWDDETDMKALENCVRSIEMEGLKWGASKLVPIAYGVKKLSISAVIVDDLVSTDDLEEKIVAFEDYIQSMDIAAFNKV